MTLKTKTALVTGSTSGIGLAIARALAAEGANIVLNGFGDAQAVEEARAGIESTYGVKARYSAADMSEPDAIAAMVREAEETFGAVDVLVNNAGIFSAKPLVQFTPEEIELQIATNLKGTLYPSQEAARHMSERRQGKIINITASIALQPHAGVPALLAVALKGGLNQATRALALELAPFGVTVNAVAPGVTDTPMHAAESHDALGRLHPLGRIARIDEINAAVLYLAKADFVSGTVLAVDGGYSAGR